MLFWSSKCKLITSYIINKTNEYNDDIVIRDRISLPIMRINLLLYFIQIEHIKRTGRLMFIDKFYAWPSGPVIPAIYYYFKKNGQEKQITTIDYLVDYSALSEAMKTTIDTVLEKTYKMDAIDLSILSRVEGGPWHQNYDKHDVEHRQAISSRMMGYYYRDKSIFAEDIGKKRTLKKNHN